MVLDRAASKYSHLGTGAGVVWSMMAWAIVGGMLGSAVAYFANAPVRLATASTFTGFGLGICVGPYAALGTSWLARVLRVPCYILLLLFYF